jgi:hypothetical protein
MVRQKDFSYRRFYRRYFGRILVTIKMAEAAFGGARVIP